VRTTNQAISGTSHVPHVPQVCFVGDVRDVRSPRNRLGSRAARLASGRAESPSTLCRGVPV
jgi:hypothetical protein